MDNCRLFLLFWIFAPHKETIIPSNTSECAALPNQLNLNPNKRVGSRSGPGCLSLPSYASSSTCTDFQEIQQCYISFQEDMSLKSTATSRPVCLHGRGPEDLFDVISTGLDGIRHLLPTFDVEVSSFIFSFHRLCSSLLDVCPFLT